MLCACLCVVCAGRSLVRNIDAKEQRDLAACTVSMLELPGAVAMPEDAVPGVVVFPAGVDSLRGVCLSSLPTATAMERSIIPVVEMLRGSGSYVAYFPSVGYNHPSVHKDFRTDSAGAFLGIMVRTVLHPLSLVRWLMAARCASWLLAVGYPRLCGRATVLFCWLWPDQGKCAGWKNVWQDGAWGCVQQALGFASLCIG
jgi:hypothetical protein